MLLVLAPNQLLLMNVHLQRPDDDPKELPSSSESPKLLANTRDPRVAQVSSGSLTVLLLDLLLAQSIDPTGSHAWSSRPIKTLRL